MYPQQQYVQQPQQPQQNQPQALNGIVFNMLDQSTFNPNLPNNNDVQAQVQLTPWLQQPTAQQLLARAVAVFRLRLQERAQRTFVHTWAYNNISQNRFQNQVWTEWCNRLAGFLEFLIVCQPQTNPPETALAKATDSMFKCYMSACVAMNPQLQQFIPQDQYGQAMHSDIQKFSQILGVINQDLQAYRSGRQMTPQQQMPQQYQQQPQYGQPQQLPPVNMAQYGQPQYAQPMAPLPLQSMAVGSQPVQALQPLPVHSAPGVGSTGMDYGIPSKEPVVTPPQQMLAQPTKPLNPVETYGVSVAPVETVAPVQQAQTVEDLSRPIPTSAAEVQMDPHYYMPAGFTVDEERPFDIIHSPGGIVTRPAYQVKDWKVTRNDTFVYTQLVDPNRFIRFYTKWPDGMVQENIVEITPQMSYIKHEIDADLRGAAADPKGKVVRTVVEVHKTIADMKPIAQVKELMLTDEDQPVQLTVEFQGSTDMENEVEARKHLRAELGLDKTAKLPAYEYRSSRTHLIDLDEDGYNTVMASLDSNDLVQLGKDLQLHTRQGVLTPRVFNFLNERLTRETNSFMRDAMSLEQVTIDNFCEDIGPLLDGLASMDTKYVTLLKGASQLILARSIQLYRNTEEDGEVTYSVNDSFINLQTGWTLAEIADGKLSEEAQLVSNFTHQALVDAIKGMYSRADDAARILNRFRVITLDGAYLEIFRGVLIQSAFMFKRVA